MVIVFWCQMACYCSARFLWIVVFFFLIHIFLSCLLLKMYFVCSNGFMVYMHHHCFFKNIALYWNKFYNENWVHQRMLCLVLAQSFRHLMTFFPPQKTIRLELNASCSADRIFKKHFLEWNYGHIDSNLLALFEPCQLVSSGCHFTTLSVHFLERRLMYFDQKFTFMYSD